MKVTSADAPKSFRALIVATLFVIMLLNMTLLVPVSPVLAESEPEEQTCGECKGSCCESSGDQCCSQGAMGCCQTTETTECTLPTTAIETEGLIMAFGKKAIMSNDKTWEAYTTVMSSELAHDTFESYRSDQYSVEKEQSLVFVNTTMNAALVFVPVVPKADPNAPEKIVFGVIEGEFVGMARLVTRSHIWCYDVCVYWIGSWCLWWTTICIDVCLITCSALAGAAGAGCGAACAAVSFGWGAVFCAILCAAVVEGVCYPTCVEWLN